MNIETTYTQIHTAKKPQPGHVLRTSLGLAIVSLLLFGFGYSLLSTNLDELLFAHAANGSLIERDGKVIGSSLVAQPFADAGYFQPRPSASNYDVMALAASNQARTHPDLRQRLEDARRTVAIREGIAANAVPSDLVTQSGGGIDPDISPASARIQMARVAKARGLELTQVAALVARYTAGKQFGLLGQPRVNVLELNLALDAASAAHGAQ